MKNTVYTTDIFMFPKKGRKCSQRRMLQTKWKLCCMEIPWQNVPRIPRSLEYLPAQLLQVSADDTRLCQKIDENVLWSKYLLRIEPEKSNWVALFCFLDTKHERNALMTRVYPQLKEFCKSKGYEFQVVDMRWGVRDESTADHMTTALCMQEIKACQELSTGPNFVVC